MTSRPSIGQPRPGGSGRLGRLDGRRRRRGRHGSEDHPRRIEVLGRAVLDYGVRAFPTVYLLGRDGRVVWEGVATGLEPSLESAIVSALSGHK